MPVYTPEAQDSLDFDLDEVESGTYTPEGKDNLTFQFQLSLISTDSASVTGETATYQATIDSLGASISNAQYYFEYREVGASTWNQTSKTSTSGGETVTAEVENLSRLAQYEVKALLDYDENGSAQTDEGSIITYVQADYVREKNSSAEWNTNFSTSNVSVSDGVVTINF